MFVEYNIYIKNKTDHRNKEQGLARQQPRLKTKQLSIYNVCGVQVYLKSDINSPLTDY